MDDKRIARILRQTVQLLEIDGAIIGRYRSYEKAAELIDSLQESIEQLVKEPEKLEELPGIGERMVEEVAVGTSDVIRRIPPDECLATLNCGGCVASEDESGDLRSRPGLSNSGRGFGCHRPLHKPRGLNRPSVAN